MNNQINPVLCEYESILKALPKTKKVPKLKGLVIPENELVPFILDTLYPIVGNYLAVEELLNETKIDSKLYKSIMSDLVHFTKFNDEINIRIGDIKDFLTKVNERKQKSENKTNIKLSQLPKFTSSQKKCPTNFYMTRRVDNGRFQLIPPDKKEEIEFLKVEFVCHIETHYGIKGITYTNQELDNFGTNGFSFLKIIYSARIELNYKEIVVKGVPLVVPDYAGTVEQLGFASDINKALVYNCGKDIYDNIKEEIFLTNLGGFSPMQSFLNSSVSFTETKRLGTKGKESIILTVSNKYEDVSFMQNLAEISLLPLATHKEQLIILSNNLVENGYQVSENSNGFTKHDALKLSSRTYKATTPDKAGVKWLKEDGGTHIVISEVKASKTLLGNLEAVKTLNPNPRYFYFFRKLLENITKDYDGSVNHKTVDFVVSLLAHGVKQPHAKLTQLERGFVVLEGQQKAGKSTLLDILHDIFGDNCTRMDENGLSNFRKGDKSVDAKTWIKTKYIVLDEMFQPNFEIGTILKDLIFKKEQRIDVKHKSPINIECNFLGFFALNKMDNRAGFPLLLEEGTDNRRYLICNSTTSLQDHLQNEWEEFITMIYDNKKGGISREAILNIINSLQQENDEYSFERFAENDQNRINILDSKSDSPQGHLKGVLHQLLKNPVDYIQSLPNINKELPKVYSQIKESKYLFSESGHVFAIEGKPIFTIFVPIGWLKKVCWNNKIPQYKSIGDFEDAIKKIIKQKNFDGQIELTTGSNRTFLKFKLKEGIKGHDQDVQNSTRF